MAGVASPMLRRAKWEGFRFLAGLAVGGALGGLVLAVPVYLLGTLAGVFPLPVRLAMLAVLCAALGVADLLGRTPHAPRQVPQALIHRLRPGTLGLAWGVDLGLLVTTRKTTSLIWITLAAVALLWPSLAAIALVVIGTVAAVAIAATSVAGLEPEAKRSRTWLRHLRRGSGVTILVALASGLLT